MNQAFVPLHGSGFVDTAKKVYHGVKHAHHFIKENQLVSKGLQYYGDQTGSEKAKRYAARARQAGYNPRGKQAATGVRVLSRSHAVKWG